MEGNIATPVSVAEEFQKLLDKRDYVLSRVEKARETKEIINGAAWEWLDEVDKLLQEMNNKKKKKGHVSVNIAPPPPEKYFNSMKDASKKLLMALQDDSYYLIGLYGKRGVGKTTLVKSEMKKYEKMFSRVIFLNMFRKDLRDMYEEISHPLNLDFNFEKDDYHTKLVSNVDSKRKEKIKSELEREDVTSLVILDNFPAVCSLSYLGIPEECSQCKVLLIIDDEAADCTKHYKKIKRQQLDCEYSILLEPLSNDEAWGHLQTLTGIVDTGSDLFNVAREVAFRCKGLPGLINDVVSSLHNKNTVKYWKETLDNLGDSTASIQIFMSYNLDCQQLTMALSDTFVKEGFKVHRSLNNATISQKEMEANAKAIAQSKCSIIVLSDNYSRYYKALHELVKIVNCKEETKQMVFPIFYDIDPSDVRHVKGSLKEGLQNALKEAKAQKGETFQREDTLKEWTSALYQVGSLPGKEYNGPRSKFIKEILEYFKNIKHRIHVKQANGGDRRLCSYMTNCMGDP